MVAGYDDYLEEKCGDSRSNLKNAITVAEGKWVNHLVGK